MADADNFVVDAPLPRIRSVSAHDGLRVTVTWESDAPGKNDRETVDLAPAVFRYKIYAPLREDADLFRTVRVTDDGFAVAWDRSDLDMASTTIAELASQAMTRADFSAFMKRHGYTLDSVAAELGISRRLAAYYTQGREIPRAIALACGYLDLKTRGEEDADLAIGLGKEIKSALPLAEEDARKLAKVGYRASVCTAVDHVSGFVTYVSASGSNPPLGFKSGVGNPSPRPDPAKTR